MNAVSTQTCRLFAAEILDQGLIKRIIKFYSHRRYARAAGTAEI